jgi:hypothetical protein
MTKASDKGTKRKSEIYARGLAATKRYDPRTSHEANETKRTRIVIRVFSCDFVDRIWLQFSGAAKVNEIVKSILARCDSEGNAGLQMLGNKLVHFFLN